MLKAHNLAKSYGLERVLDGVSLSLNGGERAGLVGPNGSGKTTLLRLLAGVERPDAGRVQLTPATARVGYLPQGLEFAPDETLADYLDHAQGDLAALDAEVEQTAAELAVEPGRADLQERYDRALDELAAASVQPGRIPATLAALGLGAVAAETPVRILSGGQKTRLALAAVLLTGPDLLLLDEPTNHLDLDMLRWLEDWLAAYRGAALVVSHDRAFLDRTVNRIIEMDPATRRTREYAGNYSDYVAAKLAEHERRVQAYAGQQEEVAQLQNAARRLRGVAVFRKGGKADSGDKFAKGFFANRGAGTIARAKAIERRIEKLLETERVEKPRLGWQMKLDFGEVPASGQDVLVLDNLAVGYDPAMPLLRGLSAVVRQGARIALVGPNGMGKTTLLRTIAGRLPPLAGRARLGANVRLGYMAQEQELLDPTLDALETIQRRASQGETEARAFLHYFLFTGDDVFVPVSALSYGERARLVLAALVVEGCNFLLLDEPINHLDLPSRARFEQALAGYAGTALAVVHDRYFIEGFASEVWEVNAAGLTIRPIAVA
jgi:ATP-binding cassette subfamily F protein 3